MGTISGLPSRPLSPSERVIRSVAAAVEVDPVELPSLYRAVYPDALDAFVTNTEEGRVEFEYAGEAVTIHAGGRIDVSDPCGGDSRDKNVAADD